MPVLLIDDDRMIGEALVKALNAVGFSVDWARDGRDAEAVIREPGYTVILLDVNLPRLRRSRTGSMAAEKRSKAAPSSI